VRYCAFRRYIEEDQRIEDMILESGMLYDDMVQLSYLLFCTYKLQHPVLQLTCVCVTPGVRLRS